MERNEGTECSNKKVGDNEEEVGRASYKSDYTLDLTVWDDIHFQWCHTSILLRLDPFLYTALLHDNKRKMHQRSQWDYVTNDFYRVEDLVWCSLIFTDNLELLSRVHNDLNTFSKSHYWFTIEKRTIFYATVPENIAWEQEPISLGEKTQRLESVIPVRCSCLAAIWICLKKKF